MLEFRGRGIATSFDSPYKRFRDETRPSPLHPVCIHVMCMRYACMHAYRRSSRSGAVADGDFKTIRYSAPRKLNVVENVFEGGYCAFGHVLAEI